MNGASFGIFCLSHIESLKIRQFRLNKIDTIEYKPQRAEKAMNILLRIVRDQISRVLLFVAALGFYISCPLVLEGAVTEKPMVVIIPSYNNMEWYERNLSSVFMQNYTNYRVIYIDDCSKDGTGKAVEQYVYGHKQEHRFQLIRNTKRLGAMANLYNAIVSCKDREIAVLLDGDDWLYHNDVLSHLNSVYSSKNIWFTHGRMIEHPSGWAGWCEPIPQYIIDTKAYRHFKHPTHLRTFYVWLFKKINPEDFKYKGEYLTMTWDMAIMFPMLEMAEERHAFINEINYVYNIANPINDNKVNAQLQRDLDRMIRNRPPYKRLEKADIGPLN